MNHRLYTPRVLICLAAIVVVASTNQAAKADSTLLGLWRFEGDLTDSSLNGFDGTYGRLSGVGSFTPTGSPSFSGDTPGGFSSQSLDFSVDNPASPAFVVNVGNDALLNPSDSMSMSAWFRTGPTAAGQTFIARDDGTNNDRAYSMHVNSHLGSLATNWTRGGAPVNSNVNSDVDGSGADFADDQWHHIIVTLDSISNGGDGILRMYVDGAFEGQAPSPSEDITTIHQNALDTIIGAFGGGTADNESLLDDVALFQGSLTDAERAAVFAGDFSSFFPALTPEPGSLLLWAFVGTGLLGGFWMRKRRMNRAAAC